MDNTLIDNLQAIQDIALINYKLLDPARTRDARIVLASAETADQFTVSDQADEYADYYDIAKEYLKQITLVTTSN